MGGSAGRRARFDKRFLAFVDILGFRSIVARMANEPELFATVRDALKTVDKQAQTFQKYRASTNAKRRALLRTGRVPLFWDSEHTLRYGGGENLYGIDEIKTFRNGQRGKKIKLEVTRFVITAFGLDFGIANCELRYLDTGNPGRMSHTWVRFTQGWRIVAAHVSPGPTA